MLPTLLHMVDEVRMFMTPASLLFRLRAPEATTAWGRFVDLYTPLLFHWAQQLGQQDSDCADLVQDVFLILWRNLPEFEYDSSKSLHAWLKTIFMNRTGRGCGSKTGFPGMVRRLMN